MRAGLTMAHLNGHGASITANQSKIPAVEGPGIARWLSIRYRETTNFGRCEGVRKAEISTLRRPFVSQGSRGWRVTKADRGGGRNGKSSGGEQQ
jgi:hypothetical protein